MPKALEPGAIGKWRNWKEQQKKVNALREQYMTELLLETLPKNLKSWLAADGGGVIQNLFEFGQASRKYRRDEGGDYGFKNLEEFAKRFEGLKVAWGDVVKIDLLWDGDYRFEVFYTAL